MEKNEYTEGRLIRFDWAMKYLLRSPANFDVLEGLLSAVLNEKIKIVDILESEGDKKSEDEKFNRVDIRCKNSAGHIIIIEVQNTSEADYFHRILFGCSQEVIKHIDRGHPYKEIPKIYSISIVYFKMGSGDDYVYHGRYVFTGLHTHSPLTFTEKEKRALDIETPSDPLPEIYFLMVEDFDKVSKTPLDQWMRFLKDGKIDPDTTVPGLKEAREKLSVMKMSREEQDRYFKFIADSESFAWNQKHDRKVVYEEGKAEGLAEGKAQGIAEGKAQGIAEGKAQGLVEGKAQGKAENNLKIARQMKADGMPTNIIAKYTGLSPEEIEKQ
ncbi:MAG: Rpn family recombination-promoting nuclease/putative transposase [Bacteroidales bacterium]|nr:Rpn family recombination-promoting nuclease/putative transposase [Bacteroidales bacterium]